MQLNIHISDWNNKIKFKYFSEYVVNQIINDKKVQVNIKFINKNKKYSDILFKLELNHIYRGIVKVKWCLLKLASIIVKLIRINISKTKNYKFSSFTINVNKLKKTIYEKLRNKYIQTKNNCEIISDNTDIIEFTKEYIAKDDVEDDI